MSLGPYTPTVAAPEQHTVKFRFQSNGAAHPDNLVPYKMGVTDVAYVSPGVFDISFDVKYPVFVGMVGMVLTATPAANDLVVNAGVGNYSSTTGVLRVTISKLDGTPAVNEVTADDWVYIEATFCRRSKLSPSGAI